MFRILLTALFICFSASAKERPNIIILMADDVGYSDIGCFGGEIKTPHLDSLADGGVRFTNFYSENMCWVSRASLLTGSYHRASLKDRGIHPAAVTLPEYLKGLGYKTYITGKWHLSSKKFPNPMDRGFDHFYGIPGGASSFFAPFQLTRDRKLIEEEYQNPDYYFTNAVSDNAAKWIKEANSSQPLFLYVAYTAAHWPLHAFDKDIEPYKSKYSMGWDKLRQQRFTRMKEMGILDSRYSISKRNPEGSSWESAGNKEWEQRRMEVYAAQLTVMDEGIGRIVKALKESGRYENSLIFFTVDNGGCHVEYEKSRKGPFLFEKTRDGKPMVPGNIPGVMPGPEATFQSYGLNWANASNTPFRYFKKYDHEGGIRTPMIAHWPKAITSKGEMIRTPAHLVDIMPTVLEITGETLPEQSFGKKSMPFDGLSIKKLLTGEESELKRENLFFYHALGKALIKDGWKIVAKSRSSWELYHLEKDPVELNNLAETHPEKLKELIREWEAMNKKMQAKNKL